jgi:cell wall-associated NlpC family hydrolase
VASRGPRAGAASNPDFVIAGPDDTLAVKPDSGVKKLTLIDSILDYADDFLGIKYRSGGKTPKGFDCSGFVMFVFKNFGYTTPPSSSAIKTVGKEVKRDSAQPGDIIYFTGTNLKTKRPGHVGIITEIEDGVIHFIHASINLGISVTNTDEAYYKKRYLGIRRVLE